MATLIPVTEPNTESLPQRPRVVLPSARADATLVSYTLAAPSLRSLTQLTIRVASLLFSGQLQAFAIAAAPILTQFVVVSLFTTTMLNITKRIRPGITSPAQRKSRM